MHVCAWKCCIRQLRLQLKFHTFRLMHTYLHGPGDSIKPSNCKISNANHHVKEINTKRSNECRTCVCCSHHIMAYLLCNRIQSTAYNYVCAITTNTVDTLNLPWWQKCQVSSSPCSRYTYHLSWWRWLCWFAVCLHFIYIKASSGEKWDGDSENSHPSPFSLFILLPSPSLRGNKALWTKCK